MPAQDDPQNDLLKRQAQIAAQASSANSVPPTVPAADNKQTPVAPQVQPSAPPAKKAEDVVDASQIQKEINEEVKEAIVKPVEPQKPPEPPTSDSAITYNPSPKTSSNQNPNAILELTKADIFKLLGMSQIPETEKKKNLDEMEETIWTDFVAEDLPKMLAPGDQARFEDLLKTAPSAEKVINFFGTPPSGGLPANFEEKYLAKTLEFKAEIAKEQIETLLETVDDPAKKATLQKAKEAAAKGFWKQVEDLMISFG